MTRLMRPALSRRTVLLAVPEIALFAGAFVGAVTLLLGPLNTTILLQDEQGAAKIALVVSLLAVFMYYYDLYDPRVLVNGRDTVGGLLKVAGATCVAVAAMYSVFPGTRLNGRAFVAGLGAAVAGALVWRPLFVLCTARPGIGRLLMVGNGELKKAIEAEIANRPEARGCIVGEVECAPDGDAAAIGRELRRMTTARRVERIVLTARGIPASALDEFRDRGFIVQDARDLYRELTGRRFDNQQPAYAAPHPERLRASYIVSKRIAIAAVAIVFATFAVPLMELMRLPERIFWVSLVAIAYTYVGYPIVLLGCYLAAQIRRDAAHILFRRDRRSRPIEAAELPPVTLLFAAYNEEAALPQKLENLRALDYPKDRLQIVIVSDGSTDATNAILERVADEANYHVLLRPERCGKAAALNAGMAYIQHDIVVLSDASTLFSPDAIRKMVRHFASPIVGVVCGALRFVMKRETQQTEGVYWKYETALRTMEGRLGATLTASGAIYAVRREVLQPLDPDEWVDDLTTTMNAHRLGLRVVHEPEAVATDFAAESVGMEFRRRVRIAVGSYRALGRMLLVPMPTFTLFAFVSHKLLRWLLPMFALALMISSALLARGDDPLYHLVFALQLTFCIWAGIGFLWARHLRPVRFAVLGYFIMAMNLAFLVGFVQALFVRKEGSWERVT